MIATRRSDATVLVVPDSRTAGVGNQEVLGNVRNEDFEM